MSRRYVVYAADRAGDTWDVGVYHEPLTALWVLEAQRRLKPMLAFGVYDGDDPERGDIQLALEELLEFDYQFTEIIEEAINAKA